MTLVLLTPSEELAVTLDDVKGHLRITDNNSDADLYGKIIAATEFVEKQIGRSLIHKDYALYLDCFPKRDRTTRFPIDSIVSIKYFDMDNVEQTIAVEDYQADLVSLVPRISPPDGKSWPNTKNRYNAVSITFKAGYSADADGIPPSITHALLLVVGHLYENREATTPVALSKLPFAVESLLAPFTRHSVG